MIRSMPSSGGLFHGGGIKVLKELQQTVKRPLFSFRVKEIVGFIVGSFAGYYIVSGLFYFIHGAL
ncbi:hypothetical protein ED312_09800 [Sinomicrobium pectinilyticum]|uniref:Uncharacterized protein n=1 Tax=Sinomicrobium pectinilyticum TaxID=1084421 RepID=A0A3N0EJA5_SINP1|nr:hypothetical protein ED312_09800 [Sinomicrobium pectinilyticum]